MRTLGNLATACLLFFGLASPRLFAAVQKPLGDEDVGTARDGLVPACDQESGDKLSDAMDIYWDDRFNLRGTNNQVYALAVDAGGNVYAGGIFGIAGSVFASRVAKWDGSSWSALGSGVDRDVHALATDGNGNLYAGGLFSIAGGISASHIAKWDGTSCLRLAQE